MAPAPLALAFTLLLCAAHAAAPLLRRWTGPSNNVLLSIGGGVAIAYVFLRLLPALQSGGRLISAALAERSGLAPFGEVVLFAVALFGFLVCFALDRWAVHSRTERSQDLGTPLAETPAHDHVFAVHLGTTAVANALIGYTLLSQVVRGPLFASLFTLALAMHFLASDAAMEAHYQAPYERYGRFLLVGALLAGWAVSLLVPDTAIQASVLLAFIGGAIVLNVVRGQVPAGEGGKAPWFVAGAVAYGALLLGLTWLADRG